MESTADSHKKKNRLTSRKQQERSRNLSFHFSAPIFLPSPQARRYTAVPARRLFEIGRISVFGHGLFRPCRAAACGAPAAALNPARRKRRPYIKQKRRCAHENSQRNSQLDKPAMGVFVDRCSTHEPPRPHYCRDYDSPLLRAAARGCVTLPTQNSTTLPKP